MLCMSRAATCLKECTGLQKTLIHADTVECVVRVNCAEQGTGKVQYHDTPR